MKNKKNNITNNSINKDFRRYILLWLSQSVSGLGSSMTGFALILWAYAQTQSALSVSLMSFCNYVPYILLSLFVGSFIDRHKKKTIMLASDSVAAIGSLAVFMLLLSGQLAIWHIYIINAVIGVTNAFQEPASAVATGKLVPKEKLSNVSGMDSFSNNLIVVFNPVLASVFFAAGGLPLILLIDLISFLVAFCTLLFFITIPEQTAAPKSLEPAEQAQQAQQTQQAQQVQQAKPAKQERRHSPFSGIAEGFAFLKKERGIFYMMLSMALINFFSRLTYENILSPMILARSAGSAYGSSLSLGIVNACMGAGGIIGGIIVSVKKESRHKASGIYMAAAVSFLFGDLMMATGRNVFFWSAAAIAASLPIPFIIANQNTILYQKIPAELQGRVFAVRNAVQYSTIPLGILLGGYLADYFFEPLMQSGNEVAGLLEKFVGSGTGSGMAAMFLCTGVCGFVVSVASGLNREIQKLN